MKTFLYWLLGFFGGSAAFIGALLVGWNSLEVYYLVTGRVEPGFEQPPLTVVVPLLILGLVLMFGGWAAHKWLKKDNPF